MHRKFPALFKGFYFTGASLVISFSIIIFSILFIESKKVRYFLMIPILFAVFFISDAMTKIIHGNHSEIIAYRYSEPVVHLISGRTNYLLAPGEILKNEFPEREIKPVSIHFRLKNPVLLPIESDYSDQAVVKQGNFIFFNGQVIAVHKGRPQQDSGIVPDVVIVPPDQKQDVQCPENGIVVSYSKFYRKDPDTKKFYFIRKSGAWRRQLNQKLKK